MTETYLPASLSTRKTTETPHHFATEVPRHFVRQVARLQHIWAFRAARASLGPLAFQNTKAGLPQFLWNAFCPYLSKLAYRVSLCFLRSIGRRCGEPGHLIYFSQRVDRPQLRAHTNDPAPCTHLVLEYEFSPCFYKYTQPHTSLSQHVCESERNRKLHFVSMFGRERQVQLTTSVLVLHQYSTVYSKHTAGP